MNRIILALLCLLIGSLPAFSQEVLLEKNVRDATETSDWGPNLKYFMHAYAGFGMVAGPAGGTGSKVDYGRSHEWQFGVRFKYKIARFYALGLETSLSPQVYFLKQKAGKMLPDENLHDSEKLRFTNLGLGFFNRFNFGKRGNHVGNFLDAGVYGNWLAFSTHIYRDALEQTGAPSAEEVTVKLDNLNYLETFHYGAMARVGCNWFSVYGTYRLSDLFNGKEGKAFPELPRMAFGLQFSLHK